MCIFYFPSSLLGKNSQGCAPLLNSLEPFSVPRATFPHPEVSALRCQDVRCQLPFSLLSLPSEEKSQDCAPSPNRTEPSWLLISMLLSFTEGLAIYSATSSLFLDAQKHSNSLNPSVLWIRRDRSGSLGMYPEELGMLDSPLAFPFSYGRKHLLKGSFLALTYVDLKNERHR